MEELKFYLNDEGMGVLETVGGYLTYFRGYRVQLSNTIEGVGDNGSSSSIIHHDFRNVIDKCSDDVTTKFKYLVGLAHVGEALRGNVEVINQIKGNKEVFNKFMTHLITFDFDQDTEYNFDLDNLVQELSLIKLNDLSSFSEFSVLEGAYEGEVKLAVGVMQTKAVLVDLDTMEGFALECQDFTQFDHAGTNQLVFEKQQKEFVIRVLLNLICFVKEYPKVYPPGFYISRVRKDSIKPSNLFSK